MTAPFKFKRDGVMTPSLSVLTPWWPSVVGDHQNGVSIKLVWAAQKHKIKSLKQTDFYRIWNLLAGSDLTAIPYLSM